MASIDESLRYTISRETTKHKLSLLRSQAAAVEDLSNAIRQYGSTLPPPTSADLLLFKAEHLKSLPIVQGEDAKELAKDALAYLRWQSSGVLKPGNGLDLWHARLDKAIGMLKGRTDWAVVFCDVLQEWLETDGRQGADNNDNSIRDTQSNEQSVKPLPPLPTETFDVKAYLSSCNVSPKLMAEIQEMAKDVTHFGSQTLKDDIHPRDVKHAMEKLSIDAKTYSPDMRRQLKSESEKPLILSELSGAFTASWKAIDSWRWPEEGVKQTLQTHLNGKDRLFLRLSILEAIFLQIVGDRWTEYLKKKITDLKKHQDWKWVGELEDCISETKGNEVKMHYQSVEEEQRYSKEVKGKEHQLNFQFSDIVVNWKNRRQKALEQAESRYDPEYDEGIDDDGEVGSYLWTAGLKATQPAKAYADVYRNITTDIHLVKLFTSDKDITVLHGDLQDFGMSVPHNVTLEVLKFFGVPLAWLKWFEIFLKIRFQRVDGTIETATRGTPFGLSVSMLVNELLLTVLDVAISAGSGAAVHRNHDDFWLWSVEPERIRNAWEIMKDFAGKTGLGWNGEKTSCTTVKGSESKSEISREGIAAPALPERRLRWGLLILQEDGTWAIDEEMVKTQSLAAEKELAKTRSFLGRINIINRYQAFLVRNAGVCTPTTGRAYISTVNTTLRIFEGFITGGENMGDWLRIQFKSAFPGTEIELVEFLQIWPIDLGGFGLQMQGPQNLAYETKLRLNEEERKEPFEEVLRQCRKDHQELLAVWETDELRTRFRMVERSESSLGEWAKEYSGMPPAISLEDYQKWYLLHRDDIENVYDVASASTQLTGADIRQSSMSLFKYSLEETFGVLQDALVPNELIPKYAIMDVQATTKQLFQSSD